MEGFQYSAFRMESRPGYAISYERDIYEQFLAGTPTPTPPEIDWWRPWLDWVRGLAAQGRTLQRVRVVDDPLTDYQQFSVWGGRWNTEAGERISYLRRTEAHRLDVPTSADWWLFDDTSLVRLNFSRDGELVGQDLEADPSVVERYRRWRDTAVASGVAADTVVSSGSGG